VGGTLEKGDKLYRLPSTSAVRENRLAANCIGVDIAIVDDGVIADKIRLLDIRFHITLVRPVVTIPNATDELGLITSNGMADRVGVITTVEAILCVISVIGVIRVRLG
jgi:hypothetical protein